MRVIGKMHTVGFYIAFVFPCKTKFLSVLLSGMYFIC
jgi:hypothetical protein